MEKNVQCQRQKSKANMGRIRGMKRDAKITCPRCNEEIELEIFIFQTFGQSQKQYDAQGMGLHMEIAAIRKHLKDKHKIVWLRNQIINLFRGGQPKC